MKFCSSDKKGFTLLELVVVVAIISIMTVSVMLSFNGFSEKIALGEIAGYLESQVSQLEMEVFQKDYYSNELAFEKEYLIVRSEQKENPLELNYLGKGANGCQAEELALELNPQTNNTLQTAQLIKKDGLGNVLEIDSYSQPSTECIPFLDAEALEWRFQLVAGPLHSKTFRFMHFNLDREHQKDLAQLSGGEGYTLQITAPYGQRTLYHNGELVNENKVELKLQTEEGEEKTFLLKL